MSLQIRKWLDPDEGVTFEDYQVAEQRYQKFLEGKFATFSRALKHLASDSFIHDAYLLKISHDWSKKVLNMEIACYNEEESKSFIFTFSGVEVFEIHQPEVDQFPGHEPTVLWTEVDTDPRLASLRRKRHSLFFLCVMESVAVIFKAVTMKRLPDLE